MSQMPEEIKSEIVMNKMVYFFDKVKVRLSFSVFVDERKLVKSSFLYNVKYLIKYFNIILLINFVSTN